LTSSADPLALPTIRRFIAFRVLFNARFYYPVFTILFLDYGLSVEEFALLNSVWAGTIVAAEVPSGVLADLLGRKRLLVATSLLMVMEMAVIALVPLGNDRLVFAAFFLNRVLSGLAEAMASGADEAIAYDTLVQAGLERQWPRVLDVQMRFRHAGYVVAMTVGALLYDSSSVNRILALLDVPLSVGQQTSMRFPVLLTLVLALACCLVTLGMREPLRQVPDNFSGQERWQRVRTAWLLTLGAGAWILRTPFALAVILLGMSLDHVLRMEVTMTSQYFRLIGLPEASFGIIGSGIALMGLVLPRLARGMVHRFSAAFNLTVVVVLALAALGGMSLFLPRIGILPVVLVFAALMLTSFFTSHYLNRVTSSDHRATVLSFKGLAFNAAYGLIGLLYAGLMERLGLEMAARLPLLSPARIDDLAFRASLAWFPGYLGLVLVLVCCLLAWRFRIQGPTGERR